MSIFWRPRGCVLWFDFAELSGDTVYDLSGNNNHGTIYNCEWRRGHLVGSLYFNGTDAYVEAPDSPSLRVSRYVTMCALVKAKGLEDGYRTVVRKGDDYSIHIRDDRFDVVTRGTGRPVAGYWVSYNFENNKLYFLTAIINTDDLKIYYYVNREFIGTRDLPSDYGEIYQSSVPFWIGYPRADTLYFYGTIHFVRVYNRVLSEREIRAHANYLLQKYIAHPPFI